MLLEVRDFNLADSAIASRYGQQWAEVDAVLTGMPLHAKASDQARIQGRPIFDPVGTNAAIKSGLVARGWQPNLPIPPEFRFLGTDVDLGKDGVIGEVQFSNYPFLLNNLMRAELLFKAGMHLAGGPTGLVIIVTKGHMFPASNSTLYFEQAFHQVQALSQNNVFDVPIRLVGLLERVGKAVPVVWTEYGGRYSRTIMRQETITCELIAGRTADHRVTLRRR